MLRVKSARVSFMLGLLQDSGNHCASIVNSFNTLFLSFIFNVVPDLTFHIDADPDPAPCQSDANLKPLVYRASKRLHCE